MRYHRAYSELAFATGDGIDLVAPDSLVAARLEPIVRDGKGAAILDLHFRKDGRHAVVPLVILDVAMLEARERDPLVWPGFVRDAGVDAIAIGDLIEPWLFELTSATPLTRETWRIFGNEDDGRWFEAARAAGMLGAAPLGEIVRRAAPYVFARRHARGRDVAIAARDAALGAAILAPLARRVRLACVDDEGLEWYRPRIADAGERFADVAIVDQEHRQADGLEGAGVTIDLDGSDGFRIEPGPAVPLDALFDFSGSVARGGPAFFVRASEPRPLRPAVVPEGTIVGGSSGRILFGLRRGALRFGGADVDLAETLAAGLRDEGFTVGIVDDPAQAAEFQPDLVHAFGLADASAAAAYQATARAEKVPYVLHALYDGAAYGGCWGATVSPYCYRFAHDEVTVENFLTMMCERRLAVNQVHANVPYHPDPHWESEVRRILGSAEVVFVLGENEIKALQGFGDGAELIPIPLPIPPLESATGVAALVGSEPFVLLHAPVEPTQNQVQAVRAAQRADLNLVIAGPIVDGAYAALVRAFAGDRTILVGAPDPAILEGLYAMADVYLDVAWVGCGLARAMRAVSRGAALAISNRLPLADLGLGDFAREVDPGDVEGIARGLGDAWYLRQGEAGRFESARREIAARNGVRDVTRAVAAGYVRALERRSQPVAR